MSKSVLILGDGYPPERDGGAERIAAYTASELQRRGYRVQVITFTGGAEKRTEADGVPAIRLHRAEYPFYWRVYRNLVSESSSRLRSLIAEFNPEYIHIHNAHQYVSLADLTYLSNRYRNVFMTLHDTMYLLNTKVAPVDVQSPETQYRKISPLASGSQHWYLNNPLYFWKARKALTKLKLIAVSRSLAQLYEVNGFQSIKVVHNGIPEIDAGAGGFRFPFDSRKLPYILHIGRLSEAKGTHVAVEAHSKLAQEFPQLQLILAGDREWGEKFRQRSTVRDRVHCVGWVTPSQAATLYEQAVCATTLSRYLDPFPTTNLEAARHGCPMVATCFGGSPEAIEDGVTGLIVNPYKSDAVVAAVRRMLLDATMRARMKEASRSRYERVFSLAAYGDRLVRAFENP